LVNTPANRRSIETEVLNVGADLFNQKALILTESDLKCLIYKELTVIQSLETPNPNLTQDGFISSCIHTELSWERAGGGYLDTPDFTLQEPGYFSCTAVMPGHPAVNLPHKQVHGLGNDSIIMELKFFRKDSICGIGARVAHDINKVLRIQQGNNNMHAYIILFSRYLRVHNWIRNRYSVNNIPLNANYAPEIIQYAQHHQDNPNNPNLTIICCSAALP